MIFIFSCLLTLGYVMLMHLYGRGWELQKEYHLPDHEFPLNYEPATFISVIIPARNEQQNIAACIESVFAQNYPKNLFEIIVVDDHSEDNTAEIVNNYNTGNICCLSLRDYLDGRKVNAYKKAAIASGVTKSKGELIVTTDADCIAPYQWLRHLAAKYEGELPVMIVAPVMYTSDNSMVQLFQLIDFMSMQGITAAAHRLKLGYMSNGANLAFSKAAYEAVNGYEGIDQLATGDDYLLMVKMAQKFPGRIVYLKSKQAIITTAPQPDWKSFFRQRIRWASKSGKYKDTRLTVILLLVYLFNVSFTVVLFAGFFKPVLFEWLAGMFVIKVIAELVFLVPVSRYFGKQHALKYFPFLQPLHILYIIAAGFFGFLGGYKWKGRSVK